MCSFSVSSSFSVSVSFNAHSHPHVDNVPDPLKNVHHKLSQPFTDEELCRALMNLNGKAAVGPQGVPSWVLKKVFNLQTARAPLLALMNSCLMQGSVPKAWAYSEVFVLYKGKGSDKTPPIIGVSIY